MGLMWPLCTRYPSSLANENWTKNGQLTQAGRVIFTGAGRGGHLGSELSCVGSCAERKPSKEEQSRCWQWGDQGSRRLSRSHGEGPALCFHKIPLYSSNTQPPSHFFLIWFFLKKVAFPCKHTNPKLRAELQCRLSKGFPDPTKWREKAPVSRHPELFVPTKIHGHH